MVIFIIGMPGSGKTVVGKKLSKALNLPFIDTDEEFKKLIQVNKKIKGKVLLETIRHEMMEASLLLSGVGWLESYEQEAVVRCMEEIFFPAWERFLKRFNTD